MEEKTANVWKEIVQAYESTKNIYKKAEFFEQLVILAEYKYYQNDTHALTWDGECWVLKRKKDHKAIGRNDGSMEVGNACA